MGNKNASKADRFITQLVKNAQQSTVSRKVDDLSLEESKKLEFLVNNGHWENLIENKTFLILSPESQVQTLSHAMEVRINELGKTLMPLGRTAETRDAYIQVLNHIHKLEKLKEEMLKRFYANLGNKQIDRDSKGKKIYF